MACQKYFPSPFQVCGEIRTKYNAMGGPTSFLLLPKSNELTNPGGTGKRSEFVGGNIYWSASTGAHPVAHDFLTKFGDHDYEQGFLGYPTTDEIVLSDSVSRRQEFKGGRIYWSPTTWAHSIQGQILTKWLSVGAETGLLGFPTSDERTTPDGIGRFNTFQNGSIYWSAATGPHTVHGPIEWFWALAGRESGVYGYPVEDPTYENDNVSQKFQKGEIVLWDGQLGGVHQVDDEYEEILPEDTFIFPEYPPFPTDPILWAQWGTKEDPDGTLTQKNLQDAGFIYNGMEDAGMENAKYLWQHMYTSPGTDVTLAPSTVDLWMDQTESREPQYPSPVAVRTENRDRTVQMAIEYADRQNKSFRADLMALGPDGNLTWTVVAAPGLLSDHFNSLGHHSMSAFTSVIAKPGAAGQHEVHLAQQAHIYDAYDYSEGGGDGVGSLGATIAVEGFRLGINKWYKVFGHGSQIKWEGLR